ncbi:MAG: hypothetical protein GC157_05355 [Frankiales bacterium]|nr:hypothetical protein [Frankiales bacterium]
MAETADTGDVLLAPRVDEADALTPRGRLAARMRLVAREGDVVWHLGDTEQEWTLPDQPRREGTPVLAAVEYADTWRPGQRGVLLPEGYLLLVADDGTPLARLARVSTFDRDLYSERDLRRIWPDPVFDRLLARGVVRRTVQYADTRELNRARPGAVPPTRSMVFSGRSVAVGWVIALVVLLVAILIARRG